MRKIQIIFTLWLKKVVKRKAAKSANFFWGLIFIFFKPFLFSR